MQYCFIVSQRCSYTPIDVEFLLKVMKLLDSGVVTVTCVTTFCARLFPGLPASRVLEGPLYFLGGG